MFLLANLWKGSYKPIWKRRVLCQENGQRLQTDTSQKPEKPIMKVKCPAFMKVNILWRLVLLWWRGRPEEARKAAAYTLEDGQYQICSASSHWRRRGPSRIWEQVPRLYHCGVFSWEALEAERAAESSSCLFSCCKNFLCPAALLDHLLWPLSYHGT